MNDVPDMDYFRKSAAARAEQRRLWPDPEMAPEVPAEDVLAAYQFDRLEHVRDWMLSNDPPSAGLVKDLKHQIGLSENCQLALRARGIEGNVPRRLSEDALEQLRSDLEDRSSAGDVQTAVVGDVFRTQRAVRLWDSGSFVHRWIFQPVPVVILKEAQPTPWEHPVVRAAACSPVPDEYEVDLADDEILVRADDDSFWIVHLWLKFPVSVEQLHSRMAHLDTRACENIAFSLAAMAEGLPLTLEEGAGEPLDPKRDAWLILERDRLYERAMWLSATADAYFEAWKSRQEIQTIGFAEEAPSTAKMEDSDAATEIAELLTYAQSEDLALAAGTEPTMRRINAIIRGERIRVELPLSTLGSATPRPRFELPQDSVLTIDGLAGVLWLFDPEHNTRSELGRFVGQHYRDKKRFILCGNDRPSPELLAALSNPQTAILLIA